MSVSQERRAAAAGFLLFFLLFASYFMLRPVRETFGIAGGVENLQWLYLGTFAGSLALVPLYGWVSARLARGKLLQATYIASATVMLGFVWSLQADPDNVWAARAFFVWISVYNQFVISLAWSLMADVFNPDQAKRLFGPIAAGASLGGLAGPLLTNVLVADVGHAGLLAISTVLLLVTIPCARWLLRWRSEHGRPADEVPVEESIGGSIWAGLTTIARSKPLAAISLFVMLSTVATTFVYFQQARIISVTFPDKVRQTEVFAAIDAAVQAMTIFIQLFLTGPIARRLGLTVLLASVPIVMIGGFLTLAAWLSFPVLAGVMMFRRVGEYALFRPAREMVFSAVDAETKYKSKNAIDTVVYRGGDLIAAWASAGIVAVASPVAAALAGAGVAVLWAWSGISVGRRFDSRPAHAPLT